MAPTDMLNPANSPPPDFEQTSSKTMRKIRENPMVPIGMAGFFAAVAYGIRNFKNRPKSMTASMYIMRFRVFAQSIAVGAMGIGIGFSIAKQHYKKTHPEKVHGSEQ
ncbi:hig1 domain family member 1a, mitochondrial [Plakobranchus ocellatus]|uniref:Hig1 domain family member 1a, mitochondrial n=1 Tax=Plakobranchus ocellatus TaxID=259542 RepID=A0AAV3Z6V5_9GAST|nr:hig1 domain family member 1a, mitochondrial [Plakobranchus ocellatus]